jgi:hypothetical protein
MPKISLLNARVIMIEIININDHLKEVNSDTNARFFGWTDGLCLGHSINWCISILPVHNRIFNYKRQKMGLTYSPL